MKISIQILSALVLQAALQTGCTQTNAANKTAATTYPDTRRVELSDDFGGTQVADPYRWLENDVEKDKGVADWISEQRNASATYLATLPGRASFRESLVSANNYSRIGAPQKEGGRYFYTRKDGERDLATLIVRQGANGRERVLIDPADWSRDGSVSLAEWRASNDGNHLAYAVQDGGSDWRSINVLNVDTGRLLPDEVKWARFTQIAWEKDGSGFYYSRYPEPKGGRDDGAGLSNHAVYFHRIGTPQADDTIFYATPDRPGQMNSVGLTADGRYAVAYSSADLVRADITVIDLESADRVQRVLIKKPKDRWSVMANVGSKLYVMTDQGAERSKIVTVDLSAPEATPTDLLPQQDAIMTSASIVGGRLLVSYLVDAKSEVRRYRLDGTPDGVVELPGIGSVTAVTGDAQEPEAFFVFGSFNQPNTVYRYDVSTDTRAPWVEPRMEVDLKSIKVDQVFYASKDGTRVPMFLVRRKDVSGSAPTVLMGYGAFGINTPAGYSAMLTAWVLQGGVLAIPNIRGGAEYGTAWHEAGRGLKKQNTIDDFIAAAEYLHAQKIAPVGGIAGYGASAGGLLIGAAVNQRPDLFGAALPSVGVMDMLRYHRFTGGQLWLGEYGNPEQSTDFKNLFSYSPYHNVRTGKPYPAILVTTGAQDNRVVPAHSYKYVAALQSMDLGPKPRLLRVDNRAGHGIGKPATQMIDEAADMWTFAAHWTGLKPKVAN